MNARRSPALQRRSISLTGRGASAWMALRSVSWMPVLLVVWVLLPKFVRGALGVTMLPERVVPAGAPMPRALGAASIVIGTLYPLLAFFVSRRFPLWNRSARHIAHHLTTLALLHAVAYVTNVLLASPGVRGFDTWTFYGHRTFEFVVYSVFAHGLLYAERYRAKEQEELTLRTDVAESATERRRAQVRALRMQWSPHFLTGTLAAIGRLLAVDVAGAKRLLLALSVVLRRLLAYVRSESARLEKEIELVEEVLKVESLQRRGLTVEWAIARDALDLTVPHMALLTMVYDALTAHERNAPLHVRIVVNAVEDSVDMQVEASGTAVSGEAADADYRTLDAGQQFQRSITPDGMCISLRHAAEPEPGRSDVPASAPVRSHAAAQTTELQEIAGPGRAFEAGTFVFFVLAHASLSLYTAYARVMNGRIELRAPAWLYIGGNGLYAALWCASLVVAARFLARRFTIEQRNWPKAVLVHGCGALCVALLNAVAFYPFQRLAIAGGVVHIGLLSYWEWGDLAIYVPLAGIAHGFIYAREYRAKQLSELQLRSQLSESELRRADAELRALKLELNPHFLFNALNTVSSLMHTNVEEARRVVGHLSAFLRRVVESTALDEVTFAEELEFIRLYMEIEQARFGEALQIVYRVQPGTSNALVPHLLIQPLVENAVKHGLRPRGGVGRVVVSSAIKGGSLEVSVVDDGAGMAPKPLTAGSGTGLANVRERLEQLYGNEQSLQISDTPGGGTTITICIPLREQRAAAPAAELAGMAT